MKSCGIVAEYNPLHTGHVYQMNKATTGNTDTGRM